ncbi:carboxymuconolactone decarboxylase family protein [Sphingomonas sp. TX0543]|uniref:carboxymuconolactone decarboxylase family protein n=1 Tax=Sphingomonas sp. TX0543 TaxID=3399682 RepID=UPI003AFAFF51
MGDVTVDETPGGQALKAEVIAKRGYWGEWHQGLLDLSPAYLAAYLDFHEPPFHAGRLDRKMCEFIYIAVDAAVSHLFVPGMQMHFDVALRLGATVAELTEVVQLTMLAAYSPHTVGLPILAEELERLHPGTKSATRSLTTEEETEKEKFVAITGFWPEGGDHLFRWAPAFVKGFLAYGEIPYREGPLSRKDKELILIAVFASPVAPQPDATRRHIRQALANGASAEEIADVLQLSSAIAIHSCVAAVPALVSAADKQQVAGDR